MAIPARGPRGGALVYGSAADVALWSKASRYALRFGLGGAGRWQRIAVVHGATVDAATSDANYFVFHDLEVAAAPVNQNQDSF